MTSASNSAPKLAWTKFRAVPRAWFQSLWSRNLKICDPKRAHPLGVIVGTRRVNLCQVLRVMCRGKDNAHWKWVVTVASRTATEINIQNNRNKNQRRCVHFCRNHKWPFLTPGNQVECHCFEKVGPCSLFTFQGKVVLCQRCRKHIFSKPNTTPVYAETQGYAGVLQSHLQSRCQLSAQLDFNVTGICISTVIIRQPLDRRTCQIQNFQAALFIWRCQSDSFFRELWKKIQFCLGLGVQACCSSASRRGHRRNETSRPPWTRVQGQPGLYMRPCLKNLKIVMSLHQTGAINSRLQIDSLQQGSLGCTHLAELQDILVDSGGWVVTSFSWVASSEPNKLQVSLWSHRGFWLKFSGSRWPA